MKYVFYQLGRPFAYLTIKHPLKPVYDWIVPLILTFTTCAYLYFFSSINLTIVGAESLIPELLSFVSGLPGFYIAALAAVATFNRSDMDLRLPVPTPEIETLIGGKDQTIKLTRRRYLCLLFAFLTSESICLIVLTRLLLKTDLSSFEFATWAMWFGAFLFFLFFWQLIVATLYGLFYMGEKMHEPLVQDEE